MVEGMEESITPGDCPIGPCVAADGSRPVMLSSQFLAPGLDCNHVRLKPCRYCRSRKLHPCHTRHFQHLLCFCTQLRELLRQHLPNALREYGINRARVALARPSALLRGSGHPQPTIYSMAWAMNKGLPSVRPTNGSRHRDWEVVLWKPCGKILGHLGDMQ